MQNHLTGRALDPKETEQLLRSARAGDLRNWQAIGLERAIALAGNRGEGARIGIIDTGINPLHPELECAYRSGVTLVESETSPNTPLRDDHGHGTAVASVICGANIGIIPNAELYVVRVASAEMLNTPYSHVQTKTLLGLSLAEALHRCYADFHCDIVNMSIGQNASDPLLGATIRDLHRSGLAIVAAAGNSYSGAFFPAAYGDAVVSVGGFGRTGKRYESTNIWPTLDLLAPAEEILAADCGTSNEKPGYLLLDGTSFSSAIVTGIMGLAVSYLKHRGLSVDPAELQKYLSATADRVTPNPEKIRNIFRAYDPTGTVLRDRPTTPALLYGNGKLRADAFIEAVTRRGR